MLRHGATRLSGRGAPAVLQGPGWGPAADYLWQTLLPALPPMQALCYDVRNTGRAPRHPGPGSQATSRLVADLGRVTAEPDRGPFVLVGHSHGALVAAGFAALYPDRVTALVLIAPAFPGAGEHLVDDDPLVRSHAADPERAAALRAFRAGPGTIRHDHELARWIRSTLPVHFHDLAHMRDFVRRTRRTPPPSVDAYRGLPRCLEGWVTAALQRVAAPTLLLAGRFDLSAPPEHVERLRAHIPGAALKVLERSAHHPWAEEPEAVRGTVADFLRQAGPEGRGRTAVTVR